MHVPLASCPATSNEQGSNTLHEKAPDAEVEGWLKTLGIESLCQWDVLVFFHGHQMSLLGPAYLASLLGYAIGPVAAALDVLESLRLVERSRVSQGVRLYRFTVPADPQRGSASEQLFALADSRAGRLALSKKLRSIKSNSTGEA